MFKCPQCGREIAMTESTLDEPIGIGLPSGALEPGHEAHCKSCGWVGSPASVGGNA